MVIDYLQLLNTGDEKLDSGQANETAKVSQVAVQLKQLARDSGAAVLALSDIIKSEQGAAFKGAEFTLNMLRGSNRIAHAADVVLALYSEAGQADGGKAEATPGKCWRSKVQDSPRARDFVRSLDDLRQAHPTGGESAAVYSRLELLKNRGGRGRGSQVLLYERAYHRFKGLSAGTRRGGRAGNLRTGYGRLGNALLDGRRTAGQFTITACRSPRYARTDLPQTLPLPAGTGARYSGPDSGGTGAVDPGNRWCRTPA